MFIPRSKDGDDIISKLLKSRIILLSGEVNETMALSITSQLLILAEDSDDDIQLFINSPGGCCNSGLAIQDTLTFIKPRVHRIGLGLCASMGAYLLTMGEKGFRKSLPNNRIMIHQVSSGARGHVNDMTISMEEAHKTNDILFNDMADAIEFKGGGKALKKWAERDRWLSAKEALGMGVIDEIVVTQK